MDKRARCPHCGALALKTICTICGKSAYEEVTAPPPRERERWWAKVDKRSARRQGIVIGGLVLFTAITGYLLTRPAAAPDPTALPAPEETSLTTSTTTPGRAPSVDRGNSSPTPTVALGESGVGRAVGDGLSPWDEAPPIHFVTGELLSERDDYTADIALVAQLLDAFPPPFTLEPLASNELVTFGGVIDLEVTEATQPFAARRLAGRTDAIGELWLIASAGSADGEAYLAAARGRWDVAAAVEQYAPSPGLRLWKLGEDASTQMWVTALTEDSLAIVQVPVGVEPTALATAVESWRDNLDG